ncbi:hypothetical protein B0H34DRAFT_735311 [Crassisporium funariophilum]|nr:hypothetical protein B0H34DRAFT_739618 [Crassisporium funariophilum]KAF8148800.1 hypothetical protein B0H34DRAFT_735311 [Crassisporium funariophilum]
MGVVILAVQLRRVVGVGGNGLGRKRKFRAWFVKRNVSPPSQPHHVPSSNPTAKGRTLPVPDTADTREAGRGDHAHTATNFACTCNKYFVRSGGSKKGRERLPPDRGEQGGLRTFSRCSYP